MRRLPFVRSVSIILASTTALVVGAIGAGQARAATVIVDCSGDAGALTPALASAVDGDTLTINGTCVGTFVVARSLELVGLTGARLDAQGAGTVVTVESGKTVGMTNLTITGGRGLPPPPSAQFAVGGIRNNGMLTLTNCAVRGNTASVVDAP